jgi:hypothetical protein
VITLGRHLYIYLKAAVSLAILYTYSLNVTKLLTTPLQRTGSSNNEILVFEELLSHWLTLSLDRMTLLVPA